MSLQTRRPTAKPFSNVNPGPGLPGYEAYATATKYLLYLGFGDRAHRRTLRTEEFFVNSQDRRQRKNVRSGTQSVPRSLPIILLVFLLLGR